ncbi:MAG TPA: fasciclin domain-containing protein [bacterium]|nr:fasciclin domain-containing protein [bacterium]
MRRGRRTIASALLVAGLVLVPTSPMPRGQAQECASVMEALSGSSTYNFTRTVRAVQAAGFTDALTQPGAFTMFAPDEQAFDRIPAWQVNYAMNHKGLLTNLLKYHIVSGAAISATQLGRVQSLQTLLGKMLPVTVQNGTIVLDGVAKVLNSGTTCANGIVYAIDRVLRP